MPESRTAGSVNATQEVTEATRSWPEHQVALVNSAGELIASAAAHAHRPINPAGLAAMTEGFWTRSREDDSYLIRVSSDEGRRVVVAESTRLLRQRVRRSLISHAAWILGLGLFLFVAINDRLVQFRGEKPQEDDVTVMLAVVV